MSLKTPLYDKHVQLGGKIVEFCGYELPVQYSGIMDEHKAVRGAAGLFDVSHMARLDIAGSDGEAFIQRMITNDIAKLAEGRIRYTFVCNAQGGVRDDVLVYRHEGGSLSLVVNAANAAKIKQHLADNVQGDAKVIDKTPSTGHIALQGPDSEKLLAAISEGALPQKYYSFAEGVGIAGVPCFVSRNGYTGEDGFEIICPADDITKVYTAIMDTGGVTPCGLGARDTLRLEASMPLYGHELEEDISPIEAGLGMFVKPDKGDFIGRDALKKQIDEGAPRKRIGIEMLQRGIAREGCDVYADGAKAGRVTSGSFCPTLGGNYAMALVDSACNADDLQVEIRGKMLDCRRVDLPFYKR